MLESVSNQLGYTGIVFLPKPEERASTHALVAVLARCCFVGEFCGAN